MKNFTLLLCSFFMATLLHAQSSPQLSAGTAAAIDVSKVLEFQETVHDFGKIAMGKPVEFDVTIKNISNEPVRIENVRVGCGCTTPKYDTTSHAPGESFKVTLGFSNMQEGNFDKYADIMFNNGITKQIRFSGTGYRVADNSAPANAALQKIQTAGK